MNATKKDLLSLFERLTSGKAKRFDSDEGSFEATVDEADVTYYGKAIGIAGEDRALLRVAVTFEDGRFEASLYPEGGSEESYVPPTFLFDSEDAAFAFVSSLLSTL